MAGCSRVVDVGLPSCTDVPVTLDDGVGADCESDPLLCDLPVHSEPAVDGEVIDMVFLAAGGLRSQDLTVTVDALMAAHRRDPRSIIGRDPELFRAHVVDVPPTPWFGTDPLPACVDTDSIGTVNVSLARVRLAAANAPEADIVVVMTPDLSFKLRESAPGNVLLVTLGGEPGTFEHELGHALVGLGDEYVEFDMCCYEGPDALPFHVGDVGLTLFPNVTTDPAGTMWDGLAAAREGADRCTRCAFGPDAACIMAASTVGTFCPVCERAIEARLHAFAPDRHDDTDRARCALESNDVDGPARGEDVDGFVQSLGVSEAAELTLTVDGAESLIQLAFGFPFHIDAARTAGAGAASLQLRCVRGDDVTIHTIPFR